MPPAVNFLDVEKADGDSQSTSNTHLQSFNSTAPTLNSTTCEPRRHGPPSGEKMAPSPSPSSLGEPTQTHTPYSVQELDISWMGAVIITCFFTSGLIDAVAFNSWNCFVGMQTGNTIFAALGLGGLPLTAHEQQYLKSFTSIGAFCIGTLFFNFLHRWPTGLHNAPVSRRRCIFALSFTVQTMLIITAASLVTAGVVSNRPFIPGVFSSGSSRQMDRTNYVDLIAVVLLAFEAAGQVCLSRVLALIELPTIVLSTLYHDFTGDLYATRQLWKSSTSLKDFILNKGRRQEKRLFSIIALFLGGVVGGEMYKSKVGMAGALWMASAVKGGIAVAFCLWREQPKAKSGEER